MWQYNDKQETTSFRTTMESTNHTELSKVVAIRVLDGLLKIQSEPNEGKIQKKITKLLISLNEKNAIRTLYQYGGIAGVKAAFHLSSNKNQDLLYTYIFVARALGVDRRYAYDMMQIEIDELLSRSSLDKYANYIVKSANDSRVHLVVINDTGIPEYLIKSILRSRFRLRCVQIITLPISSKAEINELWNHMINQYKNVPIHYISNEINDALTPHHSQIHLSYLNEQE